MLIIPRPICYLRAIAARLELMPRGRSTPDAIYELVQAKFPDYEIIGNNNSPNGRHFILKKDGATKHVKVVKKSYLKANEASEIDLLNSVSSDHVIALEDHGDISDTHAYLLFPHINGRTLDKLKDEIEWDEEAVKKMVLDVTQGIKDLKRAGITHRDIKPKNIIREESTGKFIILDLGVGYFMEGPSRDNSRIPRGDGSRYYSAPEQFKITLNEPYCLTSATDQFSLAVVTYELITKNHPYIESGSADTQNYANAVTGGVEPQALSGYATSISSEVIAAITRMMAAEPSQRFLDLDLLRECFGAEANAPTRSAPKLYVQMPKDGKEDLLEYMAANPGAIDGVIVSCSDKVEWSEKADEIGVEVIFDPKTYHLALNKSTSDIVKYLDLPEHSQYGLYEIMEMKDQLLDGVHMYARIAHSNKTVLPYFNIEHGGGPYLKFTKKLWDEARSYYQSKGRDTNNLYGGLVIPYSIIIDPGARAIVLSQLMTKHPIDGVFVVLESGVNGIATTVDGTYLEGVKHISEVLETVFDDVILYKTDLSALPLIYSSSFATGWAKAARHFKLSGQGRNIGYKMKYYAPKLFTFIEEKSNVRLIIDSGDGEAALQCDCSFCAAANPLDRSYSPNEKVEKLHFFANMANLHAATASLSRQEKDAYYKEYLEEADRLGSEIRTRSGGVVGSETIPSYEALVALINS